MINVHDLATVAVQLDVAARHVYDKYTYAWRIFHIKSHPRQRSCLYLLWNRESGWNPWAVNPYSGAYGIPQALGHGNVYPLGHARPQIRWGHQYIVRSYATACRAWAHEITTGWY